MNIYYRARAYVSRLLFRKIGSSRLGYFSSFMTPIDSILDVGCDKGMIFEDAEISDNVGFIAGVDVTKNHSQKYSHVTGDAMKLPVKSSSFSLVTAFSVIEHIQEDKRSLFFKEARRVMKEKGELLIQQPNRYALIESHTFLPLYGFLPKRWHQVMYTDREVYYVSVPSLKEVLRALKQNGFRVVSVEAYDAPFLPFGRYLKKIGLFRLFPMGYIIRANKDDGANELRNN
jgi:ubiquinone/menaquinone biosynthesis C-methylase UbiE